MNERTIKLISKENLEKIKSKRVCVLGLGGVGGYAVEALVRSGVEDLVIIDCDKIDKTNLNRQIIATNDNLGMSKTDETEKRIKSINKDCKVIKINKYIDLENLDLIFSLGIDCLIDACDSVLTKEVLIERCLEEGILFISCMGTGNKLNPLMLEICDIRKTSYDPLAKKIRKYVCDKKIKGKVPVIYSKEQNSKFSGDIPSMVFVPSVAGIMCANYIIREIIKEEY